MDLEDVIKVKEDLLYKRWSLGVPRFMTGEVWDELIAMGYTQEDLGGPRPNRTTKFGPRSVEMIKKQRRELAEGVAEHKRRGVHKEKRPKKGKS